MSQITKSLVAAIYIFQSCVPGKNEKLNSQSADQPLSRIESLIRNLEDATNDEIIVVAHRGDWRNAPENSLQAIDNCIKMGVDMVEIDIRETKDRHLVLMHDETIDRTTNGTGNVADWTLDSLQTLFLLDGLGVPTAHKIPTLEQALHLTKDKILVNLDKSYPLFDKCYQIAKETGTLHQIIIKGAKSYRELAQEFGKYLGKVYFMPIIRLPDPNAADLINGYQQHKFPVAFEFTVRYDTLKFLKKFSYIRSKGASIWVNALWPHHNGGHDDEKAVIDTSTYDWYIENNIDIIQTDRPALLLDYLRKQGLHD